MEANKTIFGKIFNKEFFMKRSFKLIAGLCASVMLLTGALTSAVSAAGSTSETSMSYADYMLEAYIAENLHNCERLPNGYFRLPNGITISYSQYYDIWSKYYWYTDAGSFIPPSFYPPVGPPSTSRPGVITDSITLDLHETTFVGYYGAACNYTSTHPFVAYVDMYGRVTAVAPGTAYIMVENDSYTFKVITVTVNEPTAETEADLGIRITVNDRYLKVGESTPFSAVVTIKGYSVSTDKYTLSYALSNSDAVSIDTDKMKLTALKEGSSDLIVTINGTNVSKSVIVYVDNKSTNIPVAPDYWYPTSPDYWYPSFTPDCWYPSYPLPEDFPILNLWPTYSDGNWVVSEPGKGIVNGLISGIISGIVGEDYMDRWNINFEYDPDKYTISYKVVYYDGQFYRVPVFVEKDAADTDDKETVLPEKPEILTPEELEKLLEEQRLAALNKAVEQAIAGKLEWYEVYSDVIGDNIYASGVKYALTNQLLTGKDDGTFGTKDEMTCGDVADLLCTYMDISEKELAKTGILPDEDEDTILSREEIALVFYNLAKEMKLDLSARKDLSGLKDYNELDADYRVAYEWATASKLMINTSSKADPNGAVTKEMLSFIIYRFNNLVK